MNCFWRKCCRKQYQSGTIVHHVIDEVRGDIVALNKFGDDEAVKLEQHVKRDLIDAVRHLDKTGNELKDWLGSDVALMKQEFWERFAEVAEMNSQPAYRGTLPGNGWIHPWSASGPMTFTRIGFASEGLSVIGCLHSL